MNRTVWAALGGIVTLLQAGCANAPRNAASSPSAASASAGTFAASGGASASSPNTSAPGRAGGSSAAGSGASGSSSGGTTSGSKPGSAGASASAAGSGAADADAGQVAMLPSGPRTAPGYMNLAPPMGAPLDGKGKDLSPPAPDGWVWYEIDGAVCRDGSPTGFYVHTGTAKKLVIYLEGGGACSDQGFCNFNPANVNQVLAGDGETVINTALGAIDGRQQPGVYTSADHNGAPAGIFDFSNAQNPFKDWSQVYVPYCTGDVHFGTMKNGSVPGLSNQQFVGYLNMKLFIARIVPTFKDVDQVILTGASAGGFGALLNYSMVQDSFGEIPVDAISDSGPPFNDMYMPVCMQKRWRDSWGFAGSLPPDCQDCMQADGGGLLKLANFLLKKHPTARVGMISGMEDEVIRLFYSVGLDNCSGYDDADPVGITVGQLADPSVLYAAQDYTAGLNELRMEFNGSGRFATYYIGGDNSNLHQHLFRPSFFDPMAGSSSAAQFVSDFVLGKVPMVGPN